MRESEVALGQTVSLVSRHGTRDAWKSNAGFMVSFGEGVNEDRSRAVVFVLGLDRAKSVSATIPLVGLDAVDRYEVREFNCGSSQHSAKIGTDGLTVGLNGPFDSAIFEFSRR